MSADTTMRMISLAFIPDIPYNSEEPQGVRPCTIDESLCHMCVGANTKRNRETFCFGCDDTVVKAETEVMASISDSMVRVDAVELV